MKKILTALAVCGAGFLLISSNVLADTASRKSAISRNLDIFNSIYRELQTNYVDSIDADKSMTTAINAMLNDIDPYTEYISENDRNDFQTLASGEYAGIGSVILQRNGNVYISDPQLGSPSQRAGLKPGDLIVTVDGDTVLGKTTMEVSKRLKGQPGTSVTVNVHRPYVGADSVLTFEIVRANIPVNTMPYYGVTGGDAGYIHLSTFNEKSAGLVRDAVTELKKDPRVKSIILDLRDNGGGLLDAAVDVAGVFLPKGTEVVRYRGREASQEKVFKTTRQPVDTKIPLVVLVNGNTASSSEIVAGSLQDLDRAVIVGTRSFGKGLVQNTRPLPYNGLLKVTFAKYYIPSGRLIQAIDYSHRNADGSVARIPDSLTREFKTAGGRTVRDGGGITPDITVTYPEGNRLTYNIVSDLWSFDYANRFAAMNETIAPMEEFVITDSIFEDFKRFIDPERFKYDKYCETGLEALRDVAKVEGCMNDSVAAQFDVLAGMLKHDLNKDLDLNREDIEEILGMEIAGRYYHDAGETIQRLRHDIAVDSALNMLKTPGRYTEILKGSKK